jgi:hypothetical protein
MLLALGGGAYYVIRSLAGVFESLDFQVGIVTSVAALVVLLSAAAIASAVKRTKRAASAHPMSGERAALYDRILRAWSVLLVEDCHPADEALKSLKAELSGFENRLVLIASPEVIRTYLALRSAQAGSPQQNGELRTQFGRLMVAMRRDIVASAPDLDENDLLSVVLSHASLPAKEESQHMDSELLRGPEDLRPRVSLAMHR